MRILAPLLLTISSILSPCIGLGELVHDESAVISREYKDHIAMLSFANVYDRDSSDSDKPGGIRAFLKMNKVGPMLLKLEQATISRDGGPWQICNYGDRAYNAGGHDPYDYKKIENDDLKYPNYFNVLVLCPSETIPADRSSGYAGIDPLKLGSYRVRFFYTLNGKQYKCEGDLNLSRVQRTGVVTKPLHLVTSKAGNNIVTYENGKNIQFTLMAEIQGSLNLNLRGEFKKAAIKKATVIAPDLKRYNLIAETCEGFPEGEGNFTRFLRPSLGERQTDFSIGHWEVTILFEVDGTEYSHNCDYDITWRDESEGIWGASEWANNSPKGEQAGADQPATKPADKPGQKDKPTPPTSKDSPR